MSSNLSFREAKVAHTFLDVVVSITVAQLSYLCSMRRSTRTKPFDVGRRSASMRSAWWLRKSEMEEVRIISPFRIRSLFLTAHIGPESDTYKRIYEEVQKIMCATLFSPVTRQEAVQATIIIAGWSTDGGWLSLGHAVRMAFEISTWDLVSSLSTCRMYLTRVTRMS